MMLYIRNIIICIFGVLIVLASSCAYKHRGSEQDAPHGQGQQDSLVLSLGGIAYDVGYNFVLVADSMELLTSAEGMNFSFEYAQDSVVIKKGEDFVITEIYRVPVADSAAVDSIWLRVSVLRASAVDNYTPVTGMLADIESPVMGGGWVSESELLGKAAPADPIALFIFYVTHNYRIFCVLSVIVGLIAIAYLVFAGKNLLLTKRKGVVSYYPIAFLLSIAAAGLVYSVLRERAPRLWQDFYFHPTLNPLGLEKLLAFYLAFFWLSLILWLASFFDLAAKLPLDKAVLCVLLHAALGFATYTVFSI